MTEAPAYSPQTAPPLSGDPNLLQLSQWMSRELERVGQRFTNHDTIQYNVMYVEPDKPRDGMIAIADGTRWNPGSGAGPYCYFGGSWVFLGLQAASLAAYMQKASNLSDVANAATSRANLGVTPANLGSTPTITVLTSGSGTYTVPASARWLEVIVVGGGGGGGAAATNPGTDGTASTFGSSFLTANGGIKGNVGGQPGGAGGTAIGGDVNINGNGGEAAFNQVSVHGGQGGTSALGGGVAAGVTIGSPANAQNNTGAGGTGGGSNAANSGGSGGGGGGYCYKLISSPLSSYAYAIGAKGTGGAAGVNAGADGGSGIIIIKEYYI